MQVGMQRRSRGKADISRATGVQGPVRNVRVGAEEMRSGLKILGQRIGSAAIWQVTVLAGNEN